MNQIKTPIWRDAHGHGRQDYNPKTGVTHNVRKRILPFWSMFCDYVVLMPNTEPALEDYYLAKKYHNECSKLLNADWECKPLTTIKFTRNVTPKTIEECAENGLLGIKIYPEGDVKDKTQVMTTNAEDMGTTRQALLNPPKWMLDVFEACEHFDFPVLHHGELPGSFCMRREAEYLPVFDFFVKKYPKLRQTLEHITTEAAFNHIEWLVNEGYPVAATVTLHHLWMRNGLDHVLGGLLEPDNFCKPIAKYPEDHKALLRAVKHNRVMMGTDSAVHEPHDKYKAGGCAGCFTACTPEMLVQLFEEFYLMDYLIPFTSTRMTEFYRLPPTTREITFEKQDWTVPGDYDGLVPFLHNTTLSWKLV